METKAEKLARYKREFERGELSPAEYESLVRAEQEDLP